MRALNVLLALLTSALIAFFVFEVGLRLLGQGPQERLVRFDPELGWSKREDFSYTNKGKEFRVAIKTNEYGLNDDPMDSPKKGADVDFRVLCLGDSFTQGFSVDREALFVDMLETWWQAEGRKLDVVNAGTEAYDNAQEVAWFLGEGARFEPDLVLIFPYYNDLYWNAQASYTASEGDRGKPRFTADGRLEAVNIEAPPEKGFLANTATFRLLAPKSRPKGTDHSFTPPGAAGPTTRELAPFLVDEPDFMRPVREHTVGAFRALAKEARSAGAEVVVVPIPPRVAFDPAYAETWTKNYFGGRSSSWDPERPVELTLELARQAGLETLDVRPALRQSAAGGESLYFDYDWHFNPLGNRAFAMALHAALDAKGLLPAATTPVAEPPVVASTDEEGAPFWVKLYVGLLVGLSLLYTLTYQEKPVWLPPLKIAALLAAVFAIVAGVFWLRDNLPAGTGPYVGPVAVIAILGFVFYKLGNRLATIAELLKAFTLRGHWYLMPLVVVLLTIGSLLVVAASSPLVAPFIYTLF